MGGRFKNIDRRTRLLMPPDLRDWVPGDDMVHFVIEAVGQLPAGSFKVNHRGSGSRQYPPGMMLALLVYCYASGAFSSRRIGQATYRDVAVRYLTADTHPDHSTICQFRTSNTEAIAEAFLHVLKVGTISVDGTRLKASASRYKNVSYQRAGQLEGKLRADIAQLLERAERADREDEDDGQRLPEELSRREKLLEKMQQARRELEQQARRRAESQQAAYREKPRRREQRQGRRKGPVPKPPRESPEPDDQVNLTDPDSRIMRKNKRSGYRQAYNAQAAVDADGAQLVLAADVTNCASDANQLLAAVKEVSETQGKPQAVLADTGYVNTEALQKLAEVGIDAYVAVSSEESHTERTYEFRPRKKRKKKKITSPVLLDMKERLQTDAGRRMYAKRKMSVEPVFGIIKEVLGFRQFLLRGIEEVRTEWRLVCLAYNMKRLYRLARA